MTRTSTTSYMKFDDYDDPWYFRIMHMNACVSFCSTTLSIYFIAFKSPRSIGHYKWFLLNISVCSLLLDLTITTLWLPQFLLPAMAICIRGLMEPLGWKLGALGGFYVWLFLMGACMMSINWAFVYRWAILTRRDHLFRRKSSILLMGLIQILFMAPTGILCAIAIWDREALVREVKQKYANIAPFIDDKVCTFASYEASIFAKPFMAMWCLQNFISTPIASTFLYLSYRALEKSKHLMSSRTVRQHKQLLIALIFQLVIPFGTLFVPYTLTALFVLLSIENIAGFYKMAFLISTLHSLLNTMMMIWKIAAYRAAFLDFIYMIASVFLPSRIKIIIMSPTYLSGFSIVPSKTMENTQTLNQKY